MRIEPNVYLVASGQNGFDMTDPYDCSVPQTIASIQHLATLEFDALLAGHLAFSLNDGKRHVAMACGVIGEMGCPQAI